MAHLHTEYLNRIKGALMEEFNYQSTMEVPKLDKVVINMGVGEASQDRKNRWGTRGPDPHLWTKASDHQSQEIHCCVQTSRRHDCWLQGNLEARTRV